MGEIDGTQTNLKQNKSVSPPLRLHLRSPCPSMFRMIGSILRAPSWNLSFVPKAPAQASTFSWHSARFSCLQPLGSKSWCQHSSSHVSLADSGFAPHLRLFVTCSLCETPECCFRCTKRNSQGSTHSTHRLLGHGIRYPTRYGCLVNHLHRASSTIVEAEQSCSSKPNSKICLNNSN